MRLRLWFLALPITFAACGDDGGDTPDTTPPDTTFTATPGDDLDTADDSVFALACDEDGCTFECSVDDGAFEACDDALTLRRLATGAHTIEARAIDAAGNVDASPASHTWSLVFGWSELASAWVNACAIAGDGGLYCWGRELVGGTKTAPIAYTRPTRIGDANDWHDLVAGLNAYCARRADGLYCWGDNYDGALGDPSLPESIEEPTRVAYDFAQLALGGYHGCGLDADGALWCWGYNSDGQVGDPTEEDYASPIAIGTKTWTRVAAGDSHTCAIDDAGALFCWGANSAYQSGQAVVTEADENIWSPTQVGADTDWIDVTLGSGHTCARKNDDTLWCWGINYVGQLGSEGITETATPTQVAGTWRDAIAAEYGTCGIEGDGTVSCWGDNLRAQLGSTTLLAAQSATPVPISHDATARSLAGTDRLRCALTDRDILCWGDNQDSGGGLGRGVAGGEPQVIALDGGWAELAINDAGGCGRRIDGTLACWGLGFHVGQPLPLAHAPIDVDANTTWTDIDVNPAGTLERAHACGIRAGRMFCWGSGAEGQLGDNGAQLRQTPVEATIPDGTFTQVSTGSNSTCAITSASELYCWGGGTGTQNWGQVGDGTGLQRNAPVRIQTPATNGWVSVHVFGGRVSAIRADGTLWGWGINPNGVSALSPTQIGTDTDWTHAISTSHGVTCGRKTSGAMWCTHYLFNPGWARPMIQVGTGTDHDQLVAFNGGACSLRAGVLHCYWGTAEGWSDNFPSYDVNGSIPNPSGTWASFDGGYSLRCGVRADGARECAGYRFAGSLGDGFDERQPAPVLLPE